LEKSRLIFKRATKISKLEPSLDLLKIVKIPECLQQLSLDAIQIRCDQIIKNLKWQTKEFRLYPEVKKKKKAEEYYNILDFYFRVIILLAIWRTVRRNRPKVVILVSRLSLVSKWEIVSVYIRQGQKKYNFKW